MAKKQEVNIVQKASLVISKEEFKSRLDECISRGEEVSKIEVPFVFPGLALGYQDPKNTPETIFETKLSNWKSYCSEILKLSFDIPNNDYQRDFSNEGRNDVLSASHDKLVQAEKNELYKKIAYLTNLRNNILPLLTARSQEEVKIIKEDGKKPPTSTKKVFIVHGHDVAKRNEVELFVKTLGYRPIILCKEPSKGQTIIEKIENNAEGACYAIVIYSACDMGRDKNTTEDRPRARQNVVFEHGYLNGKLGRKSVSALLEKDVEKPGDIDGVVYIPFDESGMWKIQIVKEMKAVGLDVDANKII